MRPLPPRMLRDAFDNASYLEIEKDRFSWTMARDSDERPFIIPRCGGLVSAKIVEQAANHANDPVLRNQVLAQLTAYYAATAAPALPGHATARPPSEPPK